MSTKQTEALKLALEALENVQYYGWGQTERDYDARTAAITALRKALALVNEVDQEQPAQQEPVDSTQISKVWWDGEKLMEKPIPFVEFYKPAQRTWVGLTDEDIDIAFDDTQEGGGFDDFARAIEAKLKAKNSP